MKTSADGNSVAYLEYVIEPDNTRYMAVLSLSLDNDIWEETKYSYVIDPASTESLVVSPNGEWIMVANFYNAGVRNEGKQVSIPDIMSTYGEMITGYKYPTTSFYRFDIKDGTYRVLKEAEEGAFEVIAISENGKVLANSRKDEITPEGRFASVPSFYCRCEYAYLDPEIDYDSNNPEYIRLPTGEYFLKGNKEVGMIDKLEFERPDEEMLYLGSEWEYLRTATTKKKNLLTDPVYNDDLGLLMLYNWGDYTVLKSYREQAEEVATIFKSDVQFFKACLSNDGRYIVGMAMTEEPNEFVIYQVDTEKKEYAKYPLKMQREEMLNCYLIAAHEVE